MQSLLEDAEERASTSSLWNFLFGSRGQERGGWQSIHKAKRLLVKALSTPVQVRTLLETTAEDLRATQQPRAIKLADRIVQLLSPQQPAPPDLQLKAELDEALSIVFSHRDGRHADEDVAHSKALLLMVIALLLIVVLAAFQNAILLLLGALGGFLSRLARSVGAGAIVTHWIELFLSPLAGALAGWAGVLVAAVLIQQQVLNIFNIRIQWDAPYALAALGLAFLLGFSERLFSQVTSAVQPQGVQQQQQQLGGGQV